MSAEEAPPQLPIGDRGYLACRGCRLILSEAQFLREGCRVCGTGPVTREELIDTTTSDFSNFVGLIAPEKSWVARLIGKTNCPNGVFAAAINDNESEEEEEIEEEEEVMDENNNNNNNNEIGGDNEFTFDGSEKGGNDSNVQGEKRIIPVMTDDELLGTRND